MTTDIACLSLVDRMYIYAASVFTNNEGIYADILTGTPEEVEAAKEFEDSDRYGFAHFRPGTYTGKVKDDVDAWVTAHPPGADRNWPE